MEILYLKHGLVSRTYSKKSLIIALTFGSKSKSFMTMSIPSQDEPLTNRPVDFAKPVKAISLPQDVPSTSNRHLIELENQVQHLMESHLAPTQPTQVNKITTSCEICSGPHDTQYCIKNPEQAFVEYASSRTDEAGDDDEPQNEGEVAPTEEPIIAAKLYVTTDKVRDMETSAHIDDNDAHFDVHDDDYVIDDATVALYIENAKKNLDVFDLFDNIGTFEIVTAAREKPNIDINNEAFEVCNDCVFLNFSNKPNGGSDHITIRGKDGSLAMFYLALKNAVDADLKVEFLAPSMETKVYGSVVAYFGKNLEYSDSDDLYYLTLFKKKCSAFVGPGSLHLMRSALAVPANSSLIIKANLFDNTSENEILSGTCEITVGLGGKATIGSIVIEDSNLKFKEAYHLWACSALTMISGTTWIDETLLSYPTEVQGQTLKPNEIICSVLFSTSIHATLIDAKTLLQIDEEAMEFDAEPVTYAMMALTGVEQDDWSMEFDSEHVHFGQDGLGDFDWSNKADDAALILELMSSNSMESDISSGDETLTDSTYENFKREKAYKAVPPPTGTIIPPRANVSFTGIDELAIRNKIVNQEKTNTSQSAIDRNKVIIEDWVDSDDEETDVSESQKETAFNTENSEESFENRSPKSQNSVGQKSKTKGLGNKGGKLCFVCYSPNHLIKDCNLHERTFQHTQTHKSKGTQGSRETRPVWNNIQRVNHSNFARNSRNLHQKRSFIPSAVLTRDGLISTVRPKMHQTVPSKSTANVTYQDTARSRVPQAVLSRSTDEYYQRMDSIRPRISSYHHHRGSIYTRLLIDHIDPKKLVKINLVKKGVTVGILNILPQTVKKECNAKIEDLKAMLIIRQWNALKYRQEDKDNCLMLKEFKVARHKVKTIRCDHGTEFKNQLMNEFCAKKGIKREYSIARTPQQNGVAERKNRTLIEAARTMLADCTFTLFQFWAGSK
ncbi:MAK10-like protein [Tanacetum coccineum]